MTTEAERATSTTTPCVGWPADDRCPTRGDMHGCTEPDGHWGDHECRCGAVLDKRRRRKVKT